MILAGDTAMASQLTGLMDFFMICNTYWQVRTQEPHASLFEINIVSASGKDIETATGIIIPTVPLPEVEEVDAILVAASVAYDKKTLADYFAQVKSLKPFLQKATLLEKPIGGFCSSTFVLAEMGLLDDKKATTVWWLAQQFQQRYPKITLQLNQMVIKDGHLFTSGATTSYLSLCLMLLEHLYDERISSQIAKIMLIEPNRTSQLPYMSLRTPNGHQDELVHKIQSWMYKNLQRHISLDDISSRFAVTKRTLNRRFKKALDDTPVNYLQRMRVEEAKRLLESSNMTLENIVYQVGYEDVSSFRKLFTELAELTPRAYRDKFKRQQMLN